MENKTLDLTKKLIEKQEELKKRRAEERKTSKPYAEMFDELIAMKKHIEVELAGIAEKTQELNSKQLHLEQLVTKVRLNMQTPEGMAKLKIKSDKVMEFGEILADAEKYFKEHPPKRYTFLGEVKEDLSRNAIWLYKFNNALHTMTGLTKDKNGENAEDENSSITSFADNSDVVASSPQ